MHLKIRLFAGLKCNNRELSCFGKNEFFLDTPDGATIGDLHQILDLPASGALVTLVNGLASVQDRVLSGNDRVGIFPPVGGG